MAQLIMNEITWFVVTKGVAAIPGYTAAPFKNRSKACEYLGDMRQLGWDSVLVQTAEVNGVEESTNFVRALNKADVVPGNDHKGLVSLKYRVTGEQLTKPELDHLGIVECYLGSDPVSSSSYVVYAFGAGDCQQAFFDATMRIWV